MTVIRWLIDNGLWHDILSYGIGMGTAYGIGRWKGRGIITEHQETQKKIADLLDASTPTGLGEIADLLRREQRKEEGGDES